LSNLNLVTPFDHIILYYVDTHLDYIEISPEKNPQIFKDILKLDLNPNGHIPIFAHVSDNLNKK
jgi:hypothetical protein